VWDSARFREAFADLTPTTPARAEPAHDDDDEHVDVTMEFGAEDSTPDRPTTGEHKAISLNAGPLPVAKE
jgi:hypothetical protein